MDVSEKVALVTGSAIGIGFEITKELLKNGVQGIVMTDINEETLKKSCDELSKQFGKNRIVFMKTDVRNEKEFEDAFKKAIDTFGRIDILVNNAGIMNDLNYELEVDINLNGVIRGILLSYKFMSKEHNKAGGLILNICSTTAVELFQCFPMYSSTKAGVLNLSRGFGHHFHFNRTGVAVIALCPGKTETALQERNLLMEGCQEELVKNISGQELQQATAVGRAAIHVIKNGKSGSIWMIDQNNLYTLHIPVWEAMRDLVIEKI